MDTHKVDRICAWIDATQAARKSLEPRNVNRVNSLGPYLGAVGSPFNDSDSNRQPPAPRPTFRSDQVPSARPGAFLSQKAERFSDYNATERPGCYNLSSRRVCSPAEDYHSAVPLDFRACTQGFLIDVRTTSEIDRDEAEARGDNANNAACERLPDFPRHYIHPTDLVSDSEPRQLKDRHRRGHSKTKQQRFSTMPDNTSNTGYIPPHMRPRQPQDYYIPPHLRNAPRNAVPQAVQQMCESSQAPATTGNRGQTSRAFQATQDKWAHQNCVDREGGDTLNEGAQISENAAANEDMTVNGGVALDAGEGNQSSDPITAPLTSAPTTPPLPNPTTSPATQQVQQNTQEINAQIPPPSAPRAMGGHRGPRMQKSNFGKTKRNDKWVTNKEIRERAQKNTHEPVGAWGSDESETGFNSNPGEDPQHDIKKLVDWQGNWLPGPTDWEARRSYHHRNFNEEMMRFVYDSIDKEATVDVRNEPTFLENPSGEVAPRVWTSLHVEGTTLQEWWNNHVGSPLADPDNVAWWRAYTSQESDLLVPHDVPEAKLDPADHEGQILNLQDYGSGRASENLKERNKKKKADRARRQAIERQMAAAAVSLTPPAEFEPPSPPSIKPSIGLYIRPALAADAHQIAGIYNHYVTHSIRSPEIEPISVTQLSRRIADETTEGMPWLVACQKSKKFSRGITTGTDALILGFACASDYFSRHSAYGFTAEAEVYVHNNYLRKKVGSCLMDRLLYILDPFHYPQEGYQFFGTGPLSEQGGVRVIGSAIMNVPYDRKDRDDLEGITKFLGNFGFKKEAELTDIGVKQEKHVNLAMFRYHTGNTIDPRSAFVS